MLTDIVLPTVGIYHRKYSRLGAILCHTKSRTRTTYAPVSRLLQLYRVGTVDPTPTSYLDSTAKVPRTVAFILRGSLLLAQSNQSFVY